MVEKTGKTKEAKMTIDDLAVMMKIGFDSMGERIERVETKLDKLTIDVVDIKEQVGVLEAKVINIDENVSTLQSSVDNFTKKVEVAEEERVSNSVAHDRFNENFSKIKEGKIEEIVAVMAMQT